MILCKEIVLESVSTFWGLRLLLLAVLMFCGWGIAYKNNNNNYFWYYAIPIIILYTLIQGLRFDRGVDYPHYAQELQYDLYAGTGITREFLYDFFVLFMRNFNIPFYFGFLFYSWLLGSGGRGGGINSLKTHLKGKVPSLFFPRVFLLPGHH